MALRKEPERRYASVRELREDIERSLAGRPVLARPDTWRYRTSKFVRRNKVVVGAALGIILALTIGLVASINFWLGEASARAKTDESLRRSRALGLATASYEVLENDGMLALLLAREAVRMERSPETLSGLHQAVGHVRERAILPDPPEAGFLGLTFSPAGDRLLALSFRRALIWDARSMPFGDPMELEGHERWILSACFSASGKYVVTTSQDKTACLWELTTGGPRPRARFPHDGWVWTAAISPDERFVVTGCADGSAKLWSIDGSEIQRLPGHTGAVRAACFSPDGTLLLTASVDTKGRLWELDPKRESYDFRAELNGHEGPITAACFSPNGDLILTASGVDDIWFLSPNPDDTARVWDLTGRQIAVLEGHTYGVESAVFSRDGKQILTASYDCTGRLWDRDGRMRQLYRLSSKVFQGSLSPDGRFVAFACKEGVRIFEVSGREVAFLGGHQDIVLSARFSPDSRWIATASMDRTVRLWSVIDEELPRYLAPGIVCAVYSPDGETVAAACEDRTARLWRADGTERARLQHEHGLGRVEFSPTGDRLITVSKDGTARLWSAEGKELQVLQHDGAVADATFSRDGGRIATACSTGARLDVWDWDASSQEFVISQSYRRWGPDPEDRQLLNLNAVAFSPDGRQLLITPRRGRAFLLTLEDDSRRSVGEALEYRAGGKATFSKDGAKILVPCLDGRVIVLQTATEVVQEFHGHDTQATCASFSPSGERIVSASADGVICIWNAVDGTLESRIRGYTGSVCTAVFSPFGDRILTASADGIARTWLVDSDELIRLAEGRTIRRFTPNELLHYEELLDVPATEAKALVEKLLAELNRKESVLDRLRQNGDLDAALRETALRFAEALSDAQ